MHIVQLPGHYYTAYLGDGEWETHEIFAENIRQAVGYFIEFVTGKFNDNPALQMLDGRESMEAAFEEDEGEPPTQMLISCDNDDCTTGYLIHKVNHKWQTKGTYVQRRKVRRKEVWEPLAAKERRFVGQGLLWKTASAQLRKEYASELAQVYGKGKVAA